MKRQKVVGDILAERNRQISLNLSGDTEEFDKSNSAND